MGERLTLRGLQSPLAGPFDATVEAGTCLAVTGASGAGKSLFLRMIADLDRNSGEAWLGEQPRSGLSAPDWRRRVVYAPAESGWWSDEVAAHFDPAQRIAAAELAERLGLPPELLSAQVARLSTGERQRLALIRALVRDPAVLLLDEPTAALDRDSIGRVEAVLKARMAAGTTLVLITHDPDQAERLGDQRLTMKAGRLSEAA